MRTKALILVCSSLIAASVVACNRSTEDEQAKAAAAQNNANGEIGKVDTEARTKADEAQKKADDKVAQAIDTANEQSAKAQTAANETIRDANEKMLASRNDLREWAQKRLNSIDNDIDKSKTKAQKADGTAKANFERALQDVETHRRDVQADLAQLDSQASSGLKDYRTRLEKAFDDFKDSVDRMDKTL